MYGRLLITFVLGVLLGTPVRVCADEQTNGIKVVVLDAGHGGVDAGTCHYGVQEKDLTLKIVLRLGALIEKEMPGVKVVYTRKTDKALGPNKAADLQERANIANRANGDLFISVHVNAVDPKKTSPEGTLTLVMGEKPKEQAYNETALYENNKDELIDMSDERTAAIVRAYIQNLQFTYGEYSLALANCIERNYKALGRPSGGVRPQMLRVLYASDMPSVLTEIGYLTHSKDAAFLKSEQGQEKIVRSLLKSVKEYSAYLLRMRGETSEGEENKAQESAQEPKQEQPSASADTVTRPAPAEQPKAQETPKKEETPKKTEQKQEVRYTIQVLASPKAVSLKSSEFKQYRGKVKQYVAPQERFKYKYGVGSFATQAEAKNELKEVRKSFPEAFIIRIQGDNVVK